MLLNRHSGLYAGRLCCFMAWIQIHLGDNEAQQNRTPFLNGQPELGSH
uniref:Uncharacterized protein n=1 Tax=Anguilla anguilla TaxID=7936 RepID=A0A0E9SYJ5_ANGAN